MKLTKTNIQQQDGAIVITYGDNTLTVHVNPEDYKRPLLNALHEFVTFVDVAPNPIDVENMLQIVCGATEKRA